MRRYLALLLVDVYNGHSKYHCTFRGGAITLWIREQYHKPITKSKPIRYLDCQDPRWTDLSVTMISRDQYQKEVGMINDVPPKEHKKRK